MAARPPVSRPCWRRSRTLLSPPASVLLAGEPRRHARRGSGRSSAALAPGGARLRRRGRRRCPPSSPKGRARRRGAMAWVCRGTQCLPPIADWPMSRRAGTRRERQSASEARQQPAAADAASSGRIAVAVPGSFAVAIRTRVFPPRNLIGASMKIAARRPRRRGAARDGRRHAPRRGEELMKKTGCTACHADRQEARRPPVHRGRGEVQAATRAPPQKLDREGQEGRAGRLGPGADAAESARCPMPTSRRWSPTSLR